MEINPARIRREVSIETDHGPAQFISFGGLVDGREHIALVFKNALEVQTPLVRIHSECLTGDVFRSGRCDCGEQLEEALRSMATVGGILLYLRQEGRGIGLYNKLDAYAEQDQGYDTFEANRRIGQPNDLRDYLPAAQMLRSLGVASLRLLTNNPDKASQLRAHGIDVVAVVPTKVHLKNGNGKYLEAKARIGGHLIDLGKSGTAG